MSTEKYFDWIILRGSLTPLAHAHTPIQVAQVPGGWFFMIIARDNVASVATLFIPDCEHSWTPNKETFTIEKISNNGNPNYHCLTYRMRVAGGWAVYTKAWRRQTGSDVSLTYIPDPDAIWQPKEATLQESPECNEMPSR